jgi:hypothetical protein
MASKVKVTHADGTVEFRSLASFQKKRPAKQEKRQRRRRSMPSDVVAAHRRLNRETQDRAERDAS